MAPSRGTQVARGAQEEAVAFLNPDTGIQGLRANFEGTITDARYETWDFKGKAKPKASGKSGVVMALHLTLDDCDDADKPEDVWWPAGAIEDFVPSDEGTSFEAITGRKGFFRDMEILQGTAALVECGAVKKSDLGIDPSIFLGKRCYWERKPPLWAKEDDKKHSVLVPTKFVGEAKKGGSAARGTASASSSRTRAAAAAAAEEEPAGGNDDLYDVAQELVLEALGDLPAKAKGQITREDLGSEVFTLLNTKYKKDHDAASRKAINALFDDDTFLEERSGRKTWAYDAKEGVVEAK